MGDIEKRVSLFCVHADPRHKLKQVIRTYLCTATEAFLTSVDNPPLRDTEVRDIAQRR